MPQTLTDDWRDASLGEDWEAAHALWLHTLGNLTLTGYDSEVSNADFPAKRQRLVEGTLHLNKLFARFEILAASGRYKNTGRDIGRAHPLDMAVFWR